MHGSQIRANGNADNTPIEKIIFEDGACINMTVNYAREGKSFAASRMEIQARKITIEETSLENRWKNL